MPPWFINPTEVLQQVSAVEPVVKCKPFSNAECHLRIVGETPNLPFTSKKFGHRLQRQNVVEVFESLSNIPRRFRFHCRTDYVPNHPAKE